MSRNSELGTFIVGRRGTILGFDHAMETLTGWQAVDVVGKSATVPHAVLVDRGEMEVDASRRRLTLELACRDGRRLETTALSERLEGPGGRARITILAVLALSAAALQARRLAAVSPALGLRGPDAVSNSS